MRLRTAVLTVCLFQLLQPWSLAQVSTVEARRLGMEVAWTAQMQLPRSGRGIVSTHLWPDASNPRKYAVVELPSRTIRVSADMLDRDGQPIGIEEAKRQAQVRAARFLGKNDGFQVVEVVIPQIKLVIVSSDGLVQNIDAESGKLLWSSACGQSSAPAHPGAISDAGVTVIHGERLYLLDWETGKHAMTVPLRYSTANSVAVSKEIGFVSDFTGRVVAYGIGKSIKPWNYVMQGRSIGRTVSLHSSLFSAIASDAGYVYVFAEAETPKIWLRYETNSAITGSLTAANDAFYVGTAGGLISKISVDSRMGNIDWEYRIGKTVTAPALVAADLVVVASESGDIVGIDDRTGIALWLQGGQNIVQPIAKVDDKILSISSAGELVSLSSKTGAPVGRTAPINLASPVVNQMSDRVYLIGKWGRVQCLRKIGAALPTMIESVKVPEEAQNPGTIESQPDTGVGESENPFNFDASGDAAMGDPFSGGLGGASDVPAGDATTDPFSGGGDPFGETTDPAGGENPFGTGNPFGSGN